MLFDRIATGRHRTVAALAASVAPLLALHVQAVADDQGVIQDSAVVAQASSGPLRCEIRTNQTDNSMELSGRILSYRALSGRFHFNVTKSGPAGSSNISQGNRFDLAVDKESQAGLVTINLERGAHVAVELSAGSDDGVGCRVTTSLQP